MNKQDLENAGFEIRVRVRDQICVQAWAQLWDQVQAWDRVRAPLRDQIWVQIRVQALREVELKVEERIANKIKRVRS